MDTELCFKPATELAAAIRARRLSPVELLEAVLDRVERVNPKVNAFTVIDAERARGAAKQAEREMMDGAPLGPLHGIPISIKDLYPVVGLPTRSGSRTTSAEPAAEDGVVTARVRKAGGTIFAKTTTPEFGCKAFTDSPLTGVTRNPWHLGRTSGGSSGGAGAATATGMGPLAVGSDGGGSIRIPSACCGVFGIKPTLGRVPNYPVVNSFVTLAAVGPMTRTVGDAALLLSVLAGRETRDPLSSAGDVPDYIAELDGDLKGVRIAWSPDFGYALLHPEIRQVVTAGTLKFSELGADLEEAHPGFSSPYPAFKVLFSASFAGRLGHLLPEHRQQMDPYLVGLVEEGLRYSAVDYYQAAMLQTQTFLAVERLFERYDLLITPVMAHPVLPFDHDPASGITISGRHFAAIREGYYPFTFPFNLTGHPAASVPCGFVSDGTPVGLQIVGRYFAEGMVLKAAAAFERAHPWARERPPV